MKRVYSDPNCPLCDGTGVIFDYDSTDAEICKCSASSKQESMVLEAGIPPKFVGCTASNFFAKKPEEESAKLAVMSWYNSFGTPNETKQGMFIYGSVGTGKTHLASVSLMGLINNKTVQPLFVSVPEFIRELSNFDNWERTNIYYEARDSEVLCLDDLGAETAKDWSRQVIFDLINHRYAHNLPTIITSNLNLDNISQVYEERTRSRICEMCVIVRLVTSDKRRNK